MNCFRLTALGLVVTQLCFAACSKSEDDDPMDSGGEGGSGGSSEPAAGGLSGAEGGGDQAGGETTAGATGEGGEGTGGVPPLGGNGGGGEGAAPEAGAGPGGAELDWPAQPSATVVWQEDFEGDAPDWSVTGGVWAVGAVSNAAGPDAFDGTAVAGTGLSADYGVNHDAWLVSPEIEVPAARDNPRFAVRYWYELAAGDTGYIYLRVDGGSWQILSTLNQSGDGSWRQFVFNLASYADRTVEFGFRITTNAANFAPGFFIDDARFETGGQPFPATDGFEAGWSYWSTYGGVWAMGEPTASDGPEPYSGDNLAGTILSGDYQINNDAWLVSPILDVPAAKDEPRVTFKYWYELASGDTAYLYYRVDGGSWQDYSTLNESGDGSWRSMTLPLGAYADRKVELGFRLTTNAAAFAPGFYVDDVRYRVGPVPLSLSQGFENGWDGWSAYGGVWAVGEPTASDGPEPHGGSALAGTVLSGDYGTNDDAWLVSPRFQVPEDSSEPSLSYWYWYELAAGDAAYAYLRVNGGSWQDFSTLTQSGGDAWRKQAIDLTPHKGKTVEVGFRLTTNAAAFAPGLYIDDVSFDL